MTNLTGASSLSNAGNHHLRLSADLNTLSVIREFVEGAALHAGLDPIAAGDITLAVDEAVTNIIVHGYQKKSGELEVRVEPLPNGVKIHLLDRAPLFDPCLCPMPDVNRPLEKRKPGGLGVYLIRQVVDEMSYRARSTGGNELVLVKYSNG
jgi:serine/threonine-protein kinase RsbW